MLDILKALCRPRRLIPLLVALVALGFLIERLWVTDAERVKGILNDARTYCLEGKWSEAIDLLDPDYAFENMTREEFRRLVQRKIQSKPLEQFTYVGREIEILEGGRAVAHATVVVRLPPGTGYPGDRIGGPVEIKFRKREDLGWVITSIRLTK
ncbi:MAG: hypothetical protein ACYS47_05440 [Planctomycetota bacterium]